MKLGLYAATLFLLSGSCAHAEIAFVTKIGSSEVFKEESGFLGVAVRGIAIDKTTGRAVHYAVSSMCFKTNFIETHAALLLEAAKTKGLDVTFVLPDTYKMPALPSDGYNDKAWPTFWRYWGAGGNDGPIRIEIPGLQARFSAPIVSCKKP